MVPQGVSAYVFLTKHPARLLEPKAHFHSMSNVMDNREEGLN